MVKKEEVVEQERAKTIEGIVRKPILGVNRYVPGKPISEVIRELGLTSVIKLASNENPLGPSPKALHAIQAALSDLNLYPDDTAYELKQAIAGYHGVKETQVVLGNGGAELIKMMGIAFLNPEDKVLLGTPSFGIYREDIKQMGSSPSEIPLAEDYTYDLNEFLKHITSKTKLIIICSPNNPTGAIVTKNRLEQFLSCVPHNVLVVLDEAYFDFVDSSDYHNGISYLPYYPNLFVLRTFSKNYGLAGLRVGYGITSPEVAFYMNKVRVLFNVNSLAQVGAIAALGDCEHLEASVRLIWEEKQFLYKGLKTLGYEFIPTFANFIAVKVPSVFEGDDFAFFSTVLRQGIIIRPGRDQRMPGYVRITIGTRQMNERLLAALKLVRETIL